MECSDRVLSRVGNEEVGRSKRDKKSSVSAVYKDGYGFEISLAVHDRKLNDGKVSPPSCFPVYHRRSCVEPSPPLTTAQVNRPFAIVQQMGVLFEYTISRVEIVYIISS